MLKTLIKKQILELFQSYVIDRKTGKAKKKRQTILNIAFFAVLLLLLGFTFYSMAAGLGAAILGGSINWLYFALMGLLSIALGVFGSVFNTYASLYLPRDNEFLMSLPIPPRILLLSRYAGVYGLSLLYSAWVWIPACIAYWVLVPVNVLNFLFPLLLTLVIGLFVSVLSCVLGWVVALVATKAKGRSFLTVFLSLFVMAAYYVVYFKIVGSLEDIITNIASISDKVGRWLHYVSLLGKAADGNVLSFLLVMVITAALTALTLFILSKTFMSLAQKNNIAPKKAEKASAPQAQTPPKKALLKREFAHFTATPIWMLNGGFGLLIMPLIAIAALIKHEALQAVIAELAVQLPELAEGFPLVIFAIIAMVVSLNAITAASISLEGKSLWVMQTLPVSPWDVLQAKEQMSALLNIVPAALSALVLGKLIQTDFSAIILLLVTLYLFCTLIADLGLFLNLRHPSLHWTNPAVPVKQGAAAGLALLIGWLFSAAISFGAFMLAKETSLTVALLVLLIVIEAVLYLLRGWLRKKGTVILSTLS